MNQNYFVHFFKVFKQTLSNYHFIKHLRYFGFFYFIYLLLFKSSENGCLIQSARRIKKVMDTVYFQLIFALINFTI